VIYRTLGKTGKKIGIIGLGCEHLDHKPYAQVKETVDAALENGVNIFDVFMPKEEVRRNIAKALGARRKDVFIQGHIGSTVLNHQNNISRDMKEVKKYFEDLLRIFDGYIDLGMMFFIDTEIDYKNVFETEFADYVQKLKSAGSIGNIGFSSHNLATAMKAIQTGLPDMMMFSINPAFDMLPSEEYVFDHFEKKFGTTLFRGLDPKRAALYQLCEQKQIGITVMKTLGAGRLISPEYTPFEKPLTVAQCIHYALSRPAVSSVMLGCQTASEVENAMQYFQMTSEEKDYSSIISSVRNDFTGNCVYCSHCEPCPSEIDIAAVNKYLAIADLTPDDIPSTIRAHYQSLVHKGNECISCGSCEARCPFGVPIMKNMMKAEKCLG